MKIFLLFTINLFSLITFDSYAQDNTNIDFKNEAKIIEELTIKSLRLRSKVNPDAVDEDLNKELAILDSTLLKEVSFFIEEYGWLSEKEIGELANMGLFLAIQHASIEEMESFKEIIEKAYLEDNIEKHQYANYVDRLKVGKDLPQIYGTQFYYDEKLNSFRFYEIENREDVNRRRKAVKLPKIEKYAKQNNIALD